LTTHVELFANSDAVFSLYCGRFYLICYAVCCYCP